MRSIRLSVLILALGLLTLAGCSKYASVSENQCIAGDWQTLGYRDGVHGHRTTRLLAHQDACGEHGVIPDRESYMHGWREGIVEYCQPDNGFDVGVRGVTYNNVCPEEIEGGFLAAYHDGRQLHQARSSVVRVQQQIREREHRLGELEAGLVRNTTRQLDPTLTHADRIERMARMKRMLDERVRIEHELPQLHEELDARLEELARVESALASMAD